MKAWFLFVAFAVIANRARAQTEEPAAIVVRPPALTTAPAGQTVRLTCVAYGSPVPNITWTLGDEDLADKVTEDIVEVGDTTFRVSVLQLCDITSADAAEYACTATNGVQGSPVADDSAKFFLSVSQPVTEPPAIVVHPPDTTSIDVDDSVEMVCVAYGNPVPTVVWSRPGCSDLNDTFGPGNIKIYSEIVTSGNITFRKSLMQICGVKADDDNQYTCTAENGISGKGQASPSASFQVRVVGAETSPTPAEGTSDATSSQELTLIIVTAVQGVIILILLLVIVVVFVIARKAPKKKSQPAEPPKQTAAESEYAAISDVTGSGTKNFPMVAANPAYGASFYTKKQEATYERVDEMK